MTRSRAENRSNRFTAKRKRRSLRAVLPALQADSMTQKTIDHSQRMREKACEEEAIMDFTHSSEP